MSEQLTFMAVHAHPDDEIFGTGGTFARLSVEGIRTVLVTATLGEHGEIVDPDMADDLKYETLKTLGTVRKLELEASVKALGISELRLLGFRDSGMVGTKENENPECFHQARFDEAVKRLVKLIRELKPHVVATYDAFGGYGHPDHLQAHRVTVAAFEAAGDARLFPELELEAWKPSKLYFTAILRSFFVRMSEEMRAQGIDGPWNNPEMDTAKWGTPDEFVTTVFDVRDYVGQKMESFKAHKTQIAPTNFMFVIPEEKRREGLGYEHFVLDRSHLSTKTFAEGERETDLFAGLR